MQKMINDSDLYANNCLTNKKEQATRPTTLDLTSKSTRRSGEGSKKICKFNFRPLLPTRSQSAPGCILAHKRDSVVVAISVTEATTLSSSSLKELTADEDALSALSSKNDHNLWYRIFIVTFVILVMLIAGSASVWSVYKIFKYAKQRKTVVQIPQVQRRKMVYPKDLTAWIDFKFLKNRNLNNPERLINGSLDSFFHKNANIVNSYRVYKVLF
nr:uncharacterized protein LOC121122183 [Lepeophtheirus salmonis]